MKYRLDRTWQKSDTIEVEAPTLEEAVEKAYTAALTFGEYVDCSMIVYIDNYDEEPPDESDIDAPTP